MHSKTKILTEVVGGHVLGSIINRVDQDKSDVISRKMEKVLGVKVLGIIPEDTNVRRAAAARSPIVVTYPDSPASKAIHRIASDLIGVAYKEDTRPRCPVKALSTGSQRHSSKRNQIKNNYPFYNFYFRMRKRGLYQTFSAILISVRVFSRI